MTLKSGWTGQERLHMVKSLEFSYRRPGFKSQNPHGDLQFYETPVPRHLMPSSSFHWCQTP